MTRSKISGVEITGDQAQCKPAFVRGTVSLKLGIFDILKKAFA